MGLIKEEMTHFLSSGEACLHIDPEQIAALTLTHVALWEQLGKALTNVLLILIEIGAQLC